MVDEAVGAVERVSGGGGVQIHPGDLTFPEPVEQALDDRSAVAAPPIRRVGDHADHVPDPTVG